MDRAKEKMREVGDARRAAYEAMCTTALAVTFTATTLVMDVTAWILLSSLRFQADAATLLSIMMLVSRLAAIMFVPAWIVVFKPRFLSRD